MDGPRGYHSKQSKSERERQIPYDIIYVWNLKYDTNQHVYETKNRLTDIEKRLAKGEGGWWREGMGVSD